MQVTGMGGKDSLANLIFSDKITNNLPLSRSPPFCLGRSFTQMTTHTHTHLLTQQRSAVSKVPWQSITAVETAQVLFIRKMLAKTSMRLWTLHTQSTATQHLPRLIHSLRPRLSTKCLCCITGLWGVIINSINYPTPRYFCKSGSIIFLFSSPPFRIWVPTY